MGGKIEIVGAVEFDVMGFDDRFLYGRSEHRPLLFDAFATMLIEKGPTDARV